MFLTAVVAPGHPSKPLGCSIQFMRLIVAAASTAVRDSETKRADGSTITAEDMITTDVCVAYVVPQTRPTMCALIDLYRDKSDDASKPYFGPASVFVSHAWKYKIAEVLDVMEQYEAGHPNTYFWFDLWVNNQNIAAALPVEWWSTTFRESIKSIGTVLLVLSPWYDPIPITRAWCLWEIMCALGQPGVTLEVMLPSKQISELKDGICRYPPSILKALADIQAEKAEAFKPSDKEMIFNAIKSSIGFNAVNERVKEKLRDWYQKVLKGIIAGCDPCNFQDLKVLNQLGYALLSLGATDQARDILESVVKAGEVAPETNDHFMSTCLANLGQLYSQMGRFDESIEIQQRALRLSIAAVGPDHAETATIHAELGLANLGRQNFEEAAKHLSRALEIKRAALGEDHEELATIYNHLGMICIAQSAHGQALEYMKKALTILIARLGETHSLTGNVFNNVGLIQNYLGNYKEAAEYFTKALAVQLNTLGPQHSGTAIMRNNIGLALYNSGSDFELALEHFQTAAAILETAPTLNLEIPSTIRANIGLVHLKLGQVAQAVQSFEKVVLILGDSHPLAGETISSIGMMMDQQGETVESVRFLDRGLQCQLKYFGADSVQAGNSRMLLASTLLKVGRKAEAKEHLLLLLPIWSARYGPYSMYVRKIALMLAECD
jgi:tetratricopeptide (TPR) repeat protein